MFRFSHNLYFNMNINNRLNFKAASLFPKATLFENEYVRIETETTEIKNELEKTMEITLKVYPKHNEMFSSFVLFENSNLIAEKHVYDLQKFIEPIIAKLEKDTYASSKTCFPKKLRAR